MKLECSPQIFETFSNVKFNEPSCSMWIDRQT